MWRKLIIRAGYSLALVLLGIQGLIIFLDVTINTLFFDELGGVLITTTLTWIIKTQRNLIKEL